MAADSDSTIPVTWVAIDIAKRSNAVVVEWPGGRQDRFRMANSYADHERLVDLLRHRDGRIRVAMEPTGTYHRPLAHRLTTEGFEVSLVSSLAAARFRDAMFNSWDKNDPKDALVILDLLKQGKVLRYYDALHAGTHDLEELSKTYMQIALARTRLHH